MIVIWIIVAVLSISGAGWVGFKMGQQTVVAEVRAIETLLRTPFKRLVLGFSNPDEAAYENGYDAAYDNVADMLKELADRIDP